MQQSLFQQGFHEGLNTANFNELTHGVLPGGSHVSKYRHAFANPAEVLQLQRNTS